MRRLVIVLAAALFLAGCDSIGNEYVSGGITEGITEISYSITIENLSDLNVFYYFYKDGLYGESGNLKAVSYSYGGYEIIDSKEYVFNYNPGKLECTQRALKLETTIDRNTIKYSFIRDENYVPGPIHR